MIKDIVLPEISENVNEAEVVNILVSVSDSVEPDQPIMELETQKAIFEIPSPEKGTIGEILVKEGDTVQVGQVLVKLEMGDSTKQAEVQPKPAKAPSPKKKETKGSTKSAEASSPKENLEKFSASLKGKEAAGDSDLKMEKKSDSVSSIQRKGSSLYPVIQNQPSKEPAPAAPHIRRLAREIGIDIHQVRGSGPGGRISEEDVKTHAKQLLQSSSGPAGFSQYTLPDLSRWGSVRHEPMSKIRQVTAENMAQAWLTVPLVSQNDAADITELEKARKTLSPKIKEAGGHLTITAILVKILAAALKEFPKFNAVPDMQSNEMIFRDYAHIGIAVDTERGLLVPVIQNADQKSLLEICQELPELVEKARSKKLMPAALEGACISISNLGGFGIGHFTPLVSGPQVAILGVGGAKQTPLFNEGQWVPRLNLPLTLSYDHRLIDGADGARFIRWVVEALENPFALALEGGF